MCVCLVPCLKPTIQNAIPTTIMHNQTNLLTHPHSHTDTHTHTHTNTHTHTQRQRRHILAFCCKNKRQRERQKILWPCLILFFLSGCNSEKVKAKNPRLRNGCNPPQTSIVLTFLKMKLFEREKRIVTFADNFFLSK